MRDLRHATVWAIQMLAMGGTIDEWQARQACEWSRTASIAAFRLENATELLKKKGARRIHSKPPTCAACAMFVESALLIRAEAEQAKYDAEREAEKRGAA